VAVIFTLELDYGKFRYHAEVLSVLPQLSKEDLQKYGEAYWHRLHQTPVCWFAQSIQGFNQSEYQVASPKNCLITPNQQIYSNETLEKFRLLAQDIFWE
jgi:hypothetical protein